MSTVTQTAPANVNGSMIISAEAENEKVAWELANREAMALSKSNWTPKHLIGKSDAETIATCVGLVVMAKKWNMAPGMVAGETYSVHGKIGFQGKLYAALANAHGNLKGGLRAIYSGKGDSFACVVFGADHELTKEEKTWLKSYLKSGDPDAFTDLELSGVKAIRVLLGQVKTDNKMWTTDPEQKIFYTGATKWCRRFMSDLVLGAISVEDIERIEYVEREPAEPRTAQLDQKLAGLLDQAADDTTQASDPQDQ